MIAIQLVSLLIISRWLYIFSVQRRHISLEWAEGRGIKGVQEVPLVNSNSEPLDHKRATDSHDVVCVPTSAQGRINLEVLDDQRRFELKIDKTLVILLTTKPIVRGEGPSVLESLKRTPKYKIKCHDEHPKESFNNKKRKGKTWRKLSNSPLPIAFGSSMIPWTMSWKKHTRWFDHSDPDFERVV